VLEGLGRGSPSLLRDPPEKACELPAAGRISNAGLRLGCSLRTSPKASRAWAARVVLGICRLPLPLALALRAWIATMSGTMLRAGGKALVDQTPPTRFASTTDGKAD